MFAYQTKTSEGKDALNIMVDGYLPAQDGVSPDVVITKEYSDVAGAEVIVIKVSGNAIVEGPSVEIPAATTETIGGVKMGTFGVGGTVDDLASALKTAGII